jgi:hypothetical protein
MGNGKHTKIARIAKIAEIEGQTPFAADLRLIAADEERQNLTTDKHGLHGSVRSKNMGICRMPQSAKSQEPVEAEIERPKANG